MHLRDFARSGHPPTLFSAFLYFDISFMESGDDDACHPVSKEPALKPAAVRVKKLEGLQID